MNYFLLSFLNNSFALDGTSGTSIFSQIVDLLFDGSNELMRELGNLIRTAANSLIYADGTGTSSELSTIFIIIVTFVGIAIVFGIIFGAFHFIKSCFVRTGR